MSKKYIVGKRKNLQRKKRWDKILLVTKDVPQNNWISNLIYTITRHTMARTPKANSKTLTSLFGTTNDVEVSKKLIRKLMQYNMKYEEITRVILSHSERAFLDARLITLEEYYVELERAKKSEVENFLSSIPAYELSAAVRA